MISPLLIDAAQLATILNEIDGVTIATGEGTSGMPRGQNSNTIRGNMAVTFQDREARAFHIHHENSQVLQLPVSIRLAEFPHSYFYHSS